MLIKRRRLKPPVCKPSVRVAFNYQGKTFRPVVNAANGEVTDATSFHDEQSGDIVTAAYAGGSIVYGHLIALVEADGRLRLHETWQWISGDQSQGTSTIEEVEK